MTPAPAPQPPRREPTPTDTASRADAICARLDALLDRLKSPLPERQES